MDKIEQFIKLKYIDKKWLIKHPKNKKKKYKKRASITNQKQLQVSTQSQSIQKSETDFNTNTSVNNKDDDWFFGPNTNVYKDGMLLIFICNVYYK